jgi:hypothetical protein
MALAEVVLDKRKGIIQVALEELVAVDRGLVIQVMVAP